MKIIDRIKHKFAMWIWRNNESTKAVNEIENAVNELREGKTKECVLKWSFNFLKSPPSNKFFCSIKLDNKAEKH